MSLQQAEWKLRSGALTVTAALYSNRPSKNQDNHREGEEVDLPTVDHAGLSGFIEGPLGVDSSYAKLYAANFGQNGRGVYKVTDATEPGCWTELRALRSLTRAGVQGLIRFFDAALYLAPNARVHLVLAMERMEASFRDFLLAQNRPLSSQEWRCVSRQLCRTLKRMEELGWVHLDIKPENLLYRTVPAESGAGHCEGACSGEGEESRPCGSSFQVKLVDFELARGPGGSTPGDLNLLTWPHFVAPELRYRVPGTDALINLASADCYALGVTLAELFLLPPVFTGASHPPTLRSDQLLDDDPDVADVLVGLLRERDRWTLADVCASSALAFNEPAHSTESPI